MLPDVVEEECDEPTIDVDNKSNQGYCSLFLQLDDESSDDLTEETRDAIVKYRFYLIKDEEEAGMKEVLFHRGSKFVKSFGTWGKKISMDVLLDEGNNFYTEECIAFGVMVSLNIKKYQS